MTRRSLQTFLSASLLVTTLLILAAAAGAQTRKERKEAKDLSDAAQAAYLQKNYRQAADQYSKSFAILSENPEGHFRKGMSHYFLKEYEPALGELDIALAQNFKPALDIYKAQWAICMETKNYDRALVAVQNAMKADPNNPDWYVAFGEISEAKGENAEALDSYQKALAKLPRNADLYYRVAVIQSKLGNTDGQASAAEEAIKRNTRFLAESYLLLGDAHFKARNYPKAIDAYERALSSKPDTYAVYKNLAESYRIEKKIDKAIETIKNGMRLFPNDGKFYTDISVYYSMDDRPDDAVAAAVSGTRLLPKESQGFTNLCRAYNDAEKYAAAVSACLSALKLSPDDGETNYYLGRALDLDAKPAEATKQYKLAVANLTTLTANNPDSADGFYLLGNALYADYQRDKALEAYKRSLELNPKLSRANFNIGLIQIDRKDKAAALEQYNSLLLTDKELAEKLKAAIDKL